jgi:tetratricopeptide (TPR) repeat protein
MHLRAEFLSDEFVIMDESAEFIDEEFVIEDEAEAANGLDVVFAGPSDAPPARVAFPVAARARAGAADRWRIAYLVFAVGVSGAMAVAICARVLARNSEVPAEVTSTPTPTATATASPTSTSTSTSTSTPTADPAPSESTDAERDAIEAADAKRLAQRALDKGKAAIAIEQGERSVALDAGDAEAWLILGAAYMQRGNFAKARRCFSSCVQMATRGARAECAALMR